MCIRDRVEDALEGLGVQQDQGADEPVGDGHIGVVEEALEEFETLLVGDELPAFPWPGREP